jgi:hypothetical protein
VIVSAAASIVCEPPLAALLLENGCQPVCRVLVLGSSSGFDAVKSYSLACRESRDLEGESESGEGNHSREVSGHRDHEANGRRIRILTQQRFCGDYFVR